MIRSALTDARFCSKHVLAAQATRPKGITMAENKTKPTDASVQQYLSAIENETRRRDCQALAQLMTKVTEQQPKMWGTSIVGFGSYHYRYASGREGDSCLIGFSSRKSDITIYLSTSFPEQQELLAQLGKHKVGKACLYLRTLAHVDLQVLEQLMISSVEALRRQHDERQSEA
jgi:Domain of unknown function (DU1801)